MTTEPTAGPVFKIWAPPESVKNTKYALEVGQKILPFLESYFDLKYPLPKLDFLAIPDFPQSSMENWGLVSFRWVILITNSNKLKRKFI